MPTSQIATFEIAVESPTQSLRKRVALFNATRRDQATKERFEWLYIRNPDGEAVVWTIHHGDAGDAVGFTAALPRRMLVDGIERMCWIGSDFSVLPKYRTLGLAVKLRRAAKEGVDAGRADFLYAHPNDQMALIHSRVGHRPVGSMVRLAKPLRFGPYVEEVTSSPGLGALAGSVLDPVRRWTDRRARLPKGLSVQHDAEPQFDERFDQLFADATRNHQGVIGLRNARYLNWRYTENPLYRTQMLTLEQNDRLVGYTLYVIDENTANIKDVFPMGDGSIAGSLLTALIRTGYQRGWQSISIGLLDTNPLLPILEQFGFRRRAETSQMFAHCPAGREYARTIMDGQQWLLTVGDRDV